MLRIAARRAFLPAVSSARVSHARVIAPVFRQSVRFNSNEAPSKPSLKEKVREASNNLASDWNAPELSYEDMKPRTEQPSPVRIIANSKIISTLTDFVMI